MLGTKCFLFSLLLAASAALCPNPQKSIFLSLRSLSNQDHLSAMFQRIGSGNTHQLSYDDKAAKELYNISGLAYRLLYNQHHQK